MRPCRAAIDARSSSSVCLTVRGLDACTGHMQPRSLNQQHDYHAQFTCFCAGTITSFSACVVHEVEQVCALREFEQHLHAMQWSNLVHVLLRQRRPELGMYRMMTLVSLFNLEISHSSWRLFWN